MGRAHGLQNLAIASIGINSETRCVRTLVVDGSDTAQRAVCELMELEPNIEVVGRVSDGVEAIAAVASLRPELVVMEIDLAYLDGLKTAAILGQYYPQIRIVLMSWDHSARQQADAHRFGADGFVYKGDLIGGMHATLRRVFPNH
jgi:DNA-binding NarL/FixJ family response regulator